MVLPDRRISAHRTNSASEAQDHAAQSQAKLRKKQLKTTHSSRSSLSHQSFVLRYTASRLTPSQPFPVQGRPPLGIQTRTEPKTITSKPSKHQTSAWISSTIWSADPKISQAIPSISSSRRLSLNPGQSHAVTDMYIMTYHDISWHMHNKMSITYVHRSHKMKQIGMYWNLTEHSSSPESGYCLPTVQQRSSKLSRSPWRSLEKQSDTSYSVALIPCRMISESKTVGWPRSQRSYSSS